MEETRKRLYQLLADKYIGKTPLYEIQHIDKEFLRKRSIRIFAKEEYKNPTGTHYDRVFLRLLERLEEKGKIHPGQTLIETTTGNAGAAFAWLCSVLGYEPYVIISKGMPSVRPVYIASLGGKVLFSKKGHYAQGTADRLTEVLKLNKGLPSDKKIYCTNHSVDDDAIVGMREAGEEIVSEFKQTSIKLDYFVAALGAGVHVRGIGEAFREDDYTKNVKIIGVEPSEAPDNFIKKYPERFEKMFRIKTEDFELKSHGLLGTGSWHGGSEVFTHIKEVLKWENLVDIVLVKKEHWWKTQQELLFKEFKHVGRTSAACLWAALSYARKKKIRNKTFLFLFYDSAWKYLDIMNGLYEKEDKLEEISERIRSER